MGPDPFNDGEEVDSDTNADTSTNNDSDTNGETSSNKESNTNTEASTNNGAAQPTVHQVEHIEVDSDSDSDSDYERQLVPVSALRNSKSPKPYARLTCAPHLSCIQLHKLNFRPCCAISRVLP